MVHTKKQFCPKGHNTFVVGRDTNGGCRECGRIRRRESNKKTYVPHPALPVQFCPKGHDTFICGRTKNNQCRICARKSNKTWLESEIGKAYIKEYHKTPQYVVYHAEYDPEYDKKRRQTPEYKEYHVQYQQEHLAAHNLATLKCSTNRALRVPQFGQDGILEFYTNKPNVYTVDHIIPLQGRKVSGLYVRWNLQYLTLFENSSKHNKANLKEISEWYGKLLDTHGLR